MIDSDTARVLAHSGMALAGILGAGLTVSVGFAATVPIHTPVRATLGRLCTWAGKALSVAPRALWAVLALPYRLAVTYLHLGWRRQRHAYVTRGRHRPNHVKRHPWSAPKGWSASAYGWSAAA